MSDPSLNEAMHVRHNPFDDPKPKRRPGTTIALLIAVFVHGALGVYLWKSRFDPKYKECSPGRPWQRPIFRRSRRCRFRRSSVGSRSLGRPPRRRPSRRVRR